MSSRRASRRFLLLSAATALALAACSDGKSSAHPRHDEYRDALSRAMAVEMYAGDDGELSTSEADCMATGTLEVLRVERLEEQGIEPDDLADLEDGDGSFGDLFDRDPLTEKETRQLGKAIVGCFDSLDDQVDMLIDGLAAESFSKVDIDLVHDCFGPAFRGNDEEVFAEMFALGMQGDDEGMEQMLFRDVFGPAMRCDGSDELLVAMFTGDLTNSALSKGQAECIARRAIEEFGLDETAELMADSAGSSSLSSSERRKVKEREQELQELFEEAVKDCPPSRR